MSGALTAGSVRGWLLAPVLSIVVGLCTAVTGILVALWLADLSFDLGWIRPNADIDDDAAIITMGFAMAGAAIGFVGGAVLGWRAIAPQRRRARENE